MNESISFSLRRKLASEYTSKSPSTGPWGVSALGIPLRGHRISSNFLLPEYRITITESQQQWAQGPTGSAWRQEVSKSTREVIQQVAARPRRSGQALPPGVQERAQQECLGPGLLGGVPGRATTLESWGPGDSGGAEAQGSLRCWVPGDLGVSGPRDTRTEPGPSRARGARGP